MTGIVTRRWQDGALPETPETRTAAAASCHQVAGRGAAGGQRPEVRSAVPTSAAELCAELATVRQSLATGSDANRAVPHLASPG